jgi:putative transcriptional regulator
VHWRTLNVPADNGARVFLLKAAPGTKMPHHTHTGTELTLVLSGAFAHQGGHYGPGDLDEADDTVEHQPIVAEGEDCICLVAMEGKLHLLGLLGRLMQPFVRI